MQYNSYTVPVECSTEVLKLARENKSSFDDKIAFREDTHTYYVEGRDNYVSCTTFYSQFFTQFDARQMATKMVADPSFPNGKPSHAKYTPLCYDTATGDRFSDECIIDNILKSWKANGDQASSKGTDLHRAIELFYNDEPVPTDIQQTTEYSYFERFHRDIVETRKWLPFRTEMMVFEPNARVCGSIDMLFIDKNDIRDLDDWRTGRAKSPLRLHMYDWKRSKKIPKFAYGRKTGLGPCMRIPDCKFMKYALQLNIYKYILELHYNVRIMSMSLGVFHPVNSSYVTHSVPCLLYTVQNMFKTRTSRKRKRDDGDI